jgi:hypothetical protein
LADAFNLESAEHYWASHITAEQRLAKSVHADWVLLRFSDQAGNWLVITQGFGGEVSGFVASMFQEARSKGVVEIRGIPARWVDTTPFNQGHPAKMIAVSWEVGRFGQGFARTPSGDIVAGSPLEIGLASNVLSLENLQRIAESLR